MSSLPKSSYVVGFWVWSSRLPAVVAAVTLPGCWFSTPTRVHPDRVDAAAAASKAMELYDKNRDGFLDLKELESVPGLRAAVKQLDTDGNGKVSGAEIQFRIRQWRDSRVGRVQVSCRITRKGTPLPGAVVKFVPESFLGESYHGGSGTANKSGMADLFPIDSMEPTLRGVSPGFYRVKITKAGETIPAQYNEATGLGVEVAGGYDMSSGVLNFDLK